MGSWTAADHSIEDVDRKKLWEDSKDHDSVYSNPIERASFLLGKYESEEEVLQFLTENLGTPEERAKKQIEMAKKQMSGEGDTTEVEGDMEDPGGMGKAEGNERSAVQEALLTAIKKSSWWVETDYDGSNLQKAPGIWRSDDKVPKRVQRLIEEVIANTNWDWATFESLSHEEANELTDMLEEKLTQPQGWSVSSLSRDIEEEFGLSEGAAVGIAADTSHSVLNTAREQAYEDMEGSEEFVYDWIGPDDHRTTPVCKEIKAEIEDRGGAVSMPTLKSILRQKAMKYEGTSEGGGTPQRIGQWQPHYQCRHTLVREVQSFPQAE